MTWARGCAPRLPGLRQRLPAEVSGREPPAVTAPLLLPSPSAAVTVVILTTTSVTRRPGSRHRDPSCRGSVRVRPPPPRPPPRPTPPPGAPRPPGPIHCGGGAGSAGRGAEMGAPPPPPPARALPQDGAGQAAALAVRGQGGPGGRPGRRLGARGAARAQPAAAGPRRGLRGQRCGPEVGARARGDPAYRREGLCFSAARLPPRLRSAAPAASPAAPGRGRGTAGFSPSEPSPGRKDHPLCYQPASGSLCSPPPSCS